MESIRRILRRLEFVAEEAMASITRSGWMSALVVITMAAALSILGGFWLLSDDVGSIATAIGSRVEIQVFLNDDADPVAVADAVKELHGVTGVEVVPKDEAWAQFQQDMKSDLKFDNLLDGNPLPNTLRVRTSDPASTEQVAEKIVHLPGIEQLSYGQELLAKLEQVSDFLRLVGLLITGLLTLATLAIMGNTIRLAIQQRRREIEIMQLVGASDAFIHWPFVLEGAFFGLLGALLTSAILVGWRGFVLSHIEALFPFVPIATTVGSTLQACLALVAIGVGIGALGSLISVHRYLAHQAG